MSSSERYVQWSADAHPSSTASCTPGPCPSWLACSRNAEAGGAAGLQHGAALVGVERTPLAEGVDPAGVRRALGQHLAADQVDVVVDAAVELGRHDVGAEERRLVGRRGERRAACEPRGRR